MNTASEPSWSLIWDWPTRLFHWLLAASMAAGWLTGGNSRYLDMHVYAGYLLLALIVFRGVWGVTGNHYARFSNFAFSPRQAARYARDAFRRRAGRHLGHNPAGSWAIYGMLLLALAIGVSGLFALGGEEQKGPLVGMLSFDTGDLLRRLHGQLVKAMWLLVAVHVTGVLWESVLHRENLAAAMFHGRKRAQAASAARSHPVVGGLLSALVITSGAGYFHDRLAATADSPYQPYSGPPLARNAAWEDECGSCHLPYHPSLLPARSWQHMFATQADHFGEDLMLSAGTASALAHYASSNAADKAATETAWHVSRMEPAQPATLRISRTVYWKQRHAAIDESVWRQENVRSPANCDACHRDAEQGTFQDVAMAIPQSPVTNTLLGMPGSSRLTIDEKESL